MMCLKLLKEIEEVYKTFFQLLRIFGRKKYYQIKKKLKSLISKVSQKNEQTNKREKTVPWLCFEKQKRYKKIDRI